MSSHIDRLIGKEAVKEYNKNNYNHIKTLKAAQ